MMDMEHGCSVADESSGEGDRLIDIAKRWHADGFSIALAIEALNEATAKITEVSRSPLLAGAAAVQMAIATRVRAIGFASELLHVAHAQGGALAYAVDGLRRELNRLSGVEREYERFKYELHRRSSEKATHGFEAWLLGWLDEKLAALAKAERSVTALRGREDMIALRVEELLKLCAVEVVVAETNAAPRKRYVGFREFNGEEIQSAIDALLAAMPKVPT